MKRLRNSILIGTIILFLINAVLFMYMWRIVQIQVQTKDEVELSQLESRLSRYLSFELSEARILLGSLDVFRVNTSTTTIEFSDENINLLKQQANLEALVINDILGSTIFTYVQPGSILQQDGVSEIDQRKLQNIFSKQREQYTRPEHYSDEESYFSIGIPLFSQFGTLTSVAVLHRDSSFLKEMLDNFQTENAGVTRIYATDSTGQSLFPEDNNASSIPFYNDRDIVNQTINKKRAVTRLEAVCYIDTQGNRRNASGLFLWETEWAFFIEHPCNDQKMPFLFLVFAIIASFLTEVLAVYTILYHQSVIYRKK